MCNFKTFTFVFLYVYFGIAFENFNTIATFFKERRKDERREEKDIKTFNKIIINSTHHAIARIDRLLEKKTLPSISSF